MKEKHKLQHTDWRERLEAMRQNINIPLDIEPDLLHKKDDANLTQKDSNEHNTTQ